MIAKLLSPVYPPVSKALKKITFEISECGILHLVCSVDTESLNAIIYGLMCSLLNHSCISSAPLGKGLISGVAVSSSILPGFNLILFSLIQPIIKCELIFKGTTSLLEDVVERKIWMSSIC